LVRDGEPTTKRTPSESALGGTDGRGRSLKALWVVLAVVAIVAAVGAVAVMVLLSRGGGDEVAMTSSASPSPLPPAMVRIMSPSNGNKVIGGQAVRVGVVATGVSDLQGIQLTVDGQATGDMELGTGPEGSKTVWLSWRPPKKGGDATLRAEAVLTDGSIIPSKAIRVLVRSATVPTPTVTVTARPSSPPQGGFWAAFFNASRSRSGAETAAADARARGFANAHVLFTPDYTSLNQDSWYAAYLGPFDTESEAEAAAGSLRSSGFEGSYAKAVY